MAFKMRLSPALSLVEEECVEISLGPGKGSKCKNKSAYKSNRKDSSYKRFKKKNRKARKEAKKRGAYKASWMS